MAEEFEIGAILNHRNVDGKTELLVEWRGFSIDQATWEPYSANDKSWLPDHKILDLYFKSKTVKQLEFKARLFKIKQRTKSIELEPLLIQTNTMESDNGFNVGTYTIDEIVENLNLIAKSNTITFDGKIIHFV
jgi:hypothetical protein